MIQNVYGKYRKPLNQERSKQVRNGQKQKIRDGQNALTENSMELLILDRRENNVYRNDREG